VGPLPEANAWPILGFVGFAAIGIWWFMTLAYARAKAQTLAPFEYTGLIWSSLFGYVFFQEIPSVRLYAGAAIIILACLVVAFETHFAARREARIAASEVAP
jgi:S-adenosylmethionine uptake transporter